MAANNPAAEPDEERGEVDPKPSTLARQIPPGSTAIWKSVLQATGGFGCERETFYREVVRGPDGFRLDFGMDEPVIFGVAIDRVHRYLFESWLRDEAPDTTGATQRAVEAARGRRTSTQWSAADWTLLADRVKLAAEKLVGEWPNRVTEKGNVLPEPVGTPPGPPVGWLAPPPGIKVDAQIKLLAKEVVGGRGISGQPDYVYREGDVFVGWADVKALSKAGSYPAKWLGGEAVAYDYLLANANSGEPAEWHTYLEYRRVMKPYWAVISAPIEPQSVSLARAYFARWGVALDSHNPDSLSFSPRSCARCQYREPMPGLDFAGCPIGAAVMAIAPIVEEDDGQAVPETD